MAPMTLLSLLINLIFVMFISMSHASDLAPALIWGGTYPEIKIVDVNPLGRTTESEFQKIVKQRIGSALPPIVVFIKDNLCIEDLTQNSKVGIWIAILFYVSFCIFYKINKLYQMIPNNL